jgi:hypothetical protein
MLDNARHPRHDKPVSATFPGAAVLVDAGIAPVNLPAPRETGGAAPTSA